MTDYFSYSDKPPVSNTRLIVPFVLLVLCLLALIVSLVGLYHTSALAEARVGDLQTSWQATTQIETTGSRIAEIDRLMQGIVRPVPEVQSAAWWSLAMAALSLVFVVWFFWGVHSVDRRKRVAYQQLERNEAVALAKLLDEIAPLASGDLDVLATAKEGTPGALADAFNYAISELQRLARLQIVASRALTEIASHTQGIAVSRDSSAGERSELVHRSSNVLLGLSNVAGDLSVQASEVAAVNKAVIELAQDSTLSLQAFSQSQIEVRDDVEATVGFMRSIIEHLQLIDVSTQQIKAIKGQVDLLTTNAALALSSREGVDEGAGQSGVMTQLSFELAALVEDLNQANGAVSLATRNIHSDVSETLSFLKQMSQTHDEQTRQVGRVATSVKRLDSSTEKFRAHASTIAGHAASQGHLVSALSKKLELINTGNDDDVDATRDNTDYLAQLNNLANEMRQSLSDFNLPVTNDSQEDKQLNDSSPSPLRRVAERAIVGD